MKTKKFFSFLVLSVVILILPSCVKETTISLSKKILPSVVLIKVYDNKGQYYGCGSGFFIDKNGIVVTNRHVIVKASKIEVKLYTSEVLDVEKILTEEQTYDLALILVKLPKKTKIKPIKLVKTYPKVGEKIVVIGNPFGLEQTVSEGIISAIREIESFGKIIQITAPVSKGSSGSPVVNFNGEVIGVASFQIVSGQNLNFAIPFDKILQLKESIKKLTVEKTQEIKNFSSKFLLLKCKFYSIFSYKLALKFCENLVDKKKYDVALLYLKTLSNKKTKDPEVFYHIGQCYTKLKNYDEAEKYYKYAIELKPDVVKYYKDLGNCYYKQEKYKEAINIYEQALKLSSNDVDLHLDLAWTYLGLKKYNKAIELLNKALKIKPDYDAIYLYFSLGYVYDRLNQLEKAIYYYKECLKLNPDYIAAIHNIARIYHIQGEKEKAIVYYTHAAKLAPEAADLPYFNIGLCYYDEGQYNEAIEAFKKSIKTLESKSEPTSATDPNWWKETYYYLGLCYLKIGEVGSAIEQYKKLKEIDKDLAEKLFNEIYH